MKIKVFTNRLNNEDLLIMVTDFSSTFAKTTDTWKTGALSSEDVQDYGIKPKHLRKNALWFYVDQDRLHEFFLI